MSVIRISKMHVRPRSQNPWQLASPLSSVVVGGVGGVAVGVDGGGGVAVPVGTLQNGYLRKVPLPRVPQVQRTSPTAVAVAATLLVNPHDTGYLPDLSQLKSTLRQFRF